jgi:hypothetical protein
VEKGSPGLTAVTLQMLPAVLCDRARRHAPVELCELAGNSGSRPRTVLAPHTADGGPQLGIDRRPPNPDRLSGNDNTFAMRLGGTREPSPVARRSRPRGGNEFASPGWRVHDPLAGRMGKSSPVAPARPQSPALRVFAAHSSPTERLRIRRLVIRHPGKRIRVSSFAKDRCLCANSGALRPTVTRLKTRAAVRRRTHTKSRRYA